MKIDPDLIRAVELLGDMKVDEFPSGIAARAAGELVEEVKRLRRGEFTAAERMRIQGGIDAHEKGCNR